MAIEHPLLMQVYSREFHLKVVDFPLSFITI